MPRQPLPPSLNTRIDKRKAKAGEKKVSLISFVIHSFNRLRGKPNPDYQDALIQQQRSVNRNPWKAVSIMPDHRGCAASKSLKEKRFLCDEAPTLPLPGCTAATCNCRYKHYADRRVGPRRAEELGIHIHLADNLPQERRRNRDRRRSTDQ